jgi:hypothetical protein
VLWPIDYAARDFYEVFIIKKYALRRFTYKRCYKWASLAWLKSVVCSSTTYIFIKSNSFVSHLNLVRHSLQTGLDIVYLYDMNWAVCQCLEYLQYIPKIM